MSKNISAVPFMTLLQHTVIISPGCGGIYKEELDRSNKLNILLLNNEFLMKKGQRLRHGKLIQDFRTINFSS